MWYFGVLSGLAGDSFFPVETRYFEWQWHMWYYYYYVPRSSIITSNIKLCCYYSKKEIFFLKSSAGQKKDFLKNLKRIKCISIYL